MLAQYIKNGALLARAKCMYGKRLTHAQYETMSAKSTIGDMIHYLKTETGYGDILAGVDENMLHYGQIGTLIRRGIFREYTRLCAQVFGDDRKLMDIILQHMEMLEFLEFLMLFVAGRQKEYLCGLPEHARNRSKVNFAGLSSCADFEMLLEMLHGTGYHAVLSSVAAHAAQSTLDFTLVEVAITVDYYEKLQKMAAHIPDAATRAAIQRRFQVETDFINISRILRMKKYYGYSSEETDKNLIRAKKKEKNPLIRTLAGAEADELDELLAKSKYGALTKQVGDNAPERIYRTLTYHNGVRVMYSPAPTVEIALAYLDLKEIEMYNIIAVVEGIRHGFSPQKIMEYLIE